MTFSGHSNRICRVAFSPDGERAVTADHDPSAKGDTVIVWDCQSGQPQSVLKSGQNEQSRTIILLR